jgi:hypothetical protein
MSDKNRSAPQSRAARRQQLVKERRNERMQRYQRNKRELMIIKVVSISLAVIVLGAIAFTGFTYLRDRDLNQEPEGVVEFSYEEGNHQASPIDYSAQPDYQGEIPPAGGAHDNLTQQCDVYTQPINDATAIHSLEHGAVWITYQPTLPADQIEKLKDKAEGDDHMLMSPYPGLPAPIVLTAWEHQLQLQAFDNEKVEQFIRSYKRNPNLTAESGRASCAGTDATVAATP